MLPNVGKCGEMWPKCVQIKSGKSFFIVTLSARNEEPNADEAFWPKASGQKSQNFAQMANKWPIRSRCLEDPAFENGNFKNCKLQI